MAAGFSKISRDHYGCSNARNRGTCDNLLTIRRDVLEESVLSGLRTHLLDPALMQEFAAEYHRELNRLSASRNRDRDRHEAELARVTRQVRAIIEAIKEGIRTPGMKEEMLQLESRKAELEQLLAEAPPPAPTLHPAMAEVYRRKVADLHAELNRPELRAQATQALRGLIEEIRLVPRTAVWRSTSGVLWRGPWGLAPNANSPPLVEAGCKQRWLRGHSTT